MSSLDEHYNAQILLLFFIQRFDENLFFYFRAVALKTHLDWLNLMGPNLYLTQIPTIRVFERRSKESACDFIYAVQILLINHTLNHTQSIRNAIINI